VETDDDLARAGAEKGGREPDGTLSLVAPCLFPFRKRRGPPEPFACSPRPGAPVYAKELMVQTVKPSSTVLVTILTPFRHHVTLNP